MFHSARLKLTAWYLLIIMSISVSFSVTIYHLLSREVERFARLQQFRIERRMRNDVFGLAVPVPPPEPPMIDPELLTDIHNRLLFSLVVINGMIFVVAGGLGYVLAGRTLRPIQKMVDEQNRFISDASHELRTPLTSLKSAFEVHLRDKNPKLSQAQELIRDSIDDVNKLQRLSESLLTLAQFQQPNSQMTMDNVSLDEVIAAAIKKIMPLAKEKMISMDFEGTPLAAKGNADSLTELLVILLDNAVKYSPAKSAVSVTAQKTDGAVAIGVKDHGVGIDERDLPHIFDRFYRADNARSKTGMGGYGLGLAIAKKIVEEHKGTITVKSTLKTGSTFTIRLPASFS